MTGGEWRDRLDEAADWGIGLNAKLAREEMLDGLVDEIGSFRSKGDMGGGGITETGLSDLRLAKIRLISRALSPAKRFPNADGSDVNAN